VHGPWGPRRFGEQGVELLAFLMALGKGDTIDISCIINCWWSQNVSAGKGQDGVMVITHESMVPNDFDSLQNTF
jgi:hypothetical protein